MVRSSPRFAKATGAQPAPTTTQVAKPKAVPKARAVSKPAAAPKVRTKKAALCDLQCPGKLADCEDTQNHLYLIHEIAAHEPSVRIPILKLLFVHGDNFIKDLARDLLQNDGNAKHNYGMKSALQQLHLGAITRSAMDEYMWNSAPTTIRNDPNTFDQDVANRKLWGAKAVTATKKKAVTRTDKKPTAPTKKAGLVVSQNKKNVIVLPSDDDDSDSDDADYDSESDSDSD